ncbi:MAG: LiaF transmembrane domain-containing protein [Anaerolineae bacterium]
MEEQVVHRSLFWPIVLIGVGVVWLLANLGALAVTHATLAHLWPIGLIALGLDALTERRAPAWGAAVGLVTVVAVLALLLAGPTLGLA